jgi:hypothetical protein
MSRIGQMKTKLHDCLDSLEILEQNVELPTAFNWTPALSAVFPARLTMSQLLAIWDAMHEAAVYEPLGSKAFAHRETTTAFERFMAGDADAVQPVSDWWIK